jgi:competence protein ComEA
MFTTLCAFPTLTFPKYQAMHRLRIWVRAFFGFSRTESNAFIVLMPLMLVILFSEPTYRWWRSRRPYEMLAENHKADSLIASAQWLDQDSVIVEPLKLTAKPFPFDPNSADELTYIKLGLAEPIAKRIVRYRNKGGKFKKKENLLRVYGMDTAWYERVKSFISITEPPQESRKVAVTNQNKREPQKTFDINTADSVALVEVYGVGPALFRRIRTFRERLGGFVSIEQLKEVYGLDSIAFKALKTKFVVSSDFEPATININEATVQQLRHPYIKWKEGDAIVAYRLQHGEIQSLEQLLEIKILNPQWLEKIRPYIRLK